MRTTDPVALNLFISCARGAHGRLPVRLTALDGRLASSPVPSGERVVVVRSAIERFRHEMGEEPNSKSAPLSVRCVTNGIVLHLNRCYVRR